MGKSMLRGWQGPKAGRGVGSGRWGGWTGRRGMGGVDGNGEGEMGKGAIGTGRGYNGEGDNVRRRWRGGRWESWGVGGGDGKGAMGRGKR